MGDTKEYIQIFSSALIFHTLPPNRRVCLLSPANSSSCFARVCPVVKFWSAVKNSSEVLSIEYKFMRLASCDYRESVISFCGVKIKVRPSTLPALCDTQAPEPRRSVRRSINIVKREVPVIFYTL